MLALFDVDGVLLIAYDPLSFRASRLAARAVWGVTLERSDLVGIDHPGRATQEIYAQMLARKGIVGAELEAGLACFVELTGRRYVVLLARADTSHWRFPDGAVGALERLAAAGVETVLLTGNVEPKARARMERLGLARFFALGQGAFGSDAFAKTELIPIALGRAGASPHEAVLVGDAPHDVTAARLAGVGCVAVTTGAFDAAALAGADAITASLPEAAEAVIRLLSGNARQCTSMR